MQGTRLIRYGVLLAIIALLTGVGQGWAAPLSQDAVWTVTYPPEGSTINGAVNIQGTATHPGFVSYGILYAPGDTVTGGTDWVHDNPIAWNMQSMVVNGTLGTWDTTTVPNGKYVLALVVYEAGNETPNVYFVQNLTVQNEAATPTPEPTLEPPPTEMSAAPTAESAAPIAPTIEQPPTATPRPTPTLSPEVAPGPDEGGEGEEKPKTIISMDAVREAFKTGAQLAVMIYVIGGLYVAVKAAIRYALRLQRKKQGP